jgi:competence protein ComEC
MKLPAVVIAAAFAGGILLGLRAPPQLFSSLRTSIAISFALAVAAWIASAVFLRYDSLWTAGIASILVWAALGVGSGLIATQPLSRNHVVQRIAANEIPLKVPLRWHGTLREEPALMPWGHVLVLNLSSVDLADSQLPLVGGMRIAFTPKEGDAALPEIHAGDELVVVTQARLPLVYRDAGAFDRREFLARQNIHLVATLRASSLLEKTTTVTPSFHTRLAKIRARFRQRLDAMFPQAPEIAAVLRSMLLGDRSFLDRAESVDYQKSGVYHVLVIAGLHVGAFAFFLLWISRKLRLPNWLAAICVVALLFTYILIVEQRPPVVRAGLMAGIFVLGTLFFRRLELLSSAAIAAVVLLLANPKELLDTSFQLSFLAIGCIAAIALPWMQTRTQPLTRGLRAWRDVTRDAIYSPRIAQFRLDLRDLCRWLASHLPQRVTKTAQDTTIHSLAFSLRVVEMFALSLVLQFGMSPLMARDFHRVTLIGPLANLVVVPLTAVIVPVGFLGLSTSMLTPTVGHLFSGPLLLLVRLQTFLVGAFAHIPHSSYRIPAPPFWLLLAFFAAAIVLAWSFHSQRQWAAFASRTSLLVLFVLIFLIATSPFHISAERGALEVTILDVAQGDSILVVSPKGSTLLIDGGGAFQGFRGREEHLGPDPGEDAVSAYLWSRGIQRLDAVALTHAHQDHIGGLTAVLQNFRVQRLFLGRESTAPAQIQLEELAARLQVPVEHERKGQSFDWDGVRVTFLWPEISADEVAPTAKNNDSLVVRLEYGQRSFLLPGDAEKQVEYTMLSENDPRMLRADVLKVGHHGSKNSTTAQFLFAVDPQIAVISSGEENPYGHPSPELLQRLKQSGARILRTDQDGAVQILTDGRGLRVNCYVACDESSEESSSAQTPNHHQRD